MRTRNILVALAVLVSSSAFGVGFEFVNMKREDLFVIRDPDQEAQMRIELIDQAQNSIDLITYDLRDDHTGKLVLDALMRAAERGVKVRVMTGWSSSVFSSSSKVLTKDFRHCYRDSVEEYLKQSPASDSISYQLVGGPTLGNPPAPHGSQSGRLSFLNSMREQVNFVRKDVFASPMKVLREQTLGPYDLADGIHEKILSVDGEVLMYTGRGYGDSYKKWQDMAFLAKGPLVQQAASAYEDLWKFVSPRKTHGLSSSLHRAEDYCTKKLEQTKQLRLQAQQALSRSLRSPIEKWNALQANLKEYLRGVLPRACSTGSMTPMIAEKSGVEKAEDIQSISSESDWSLSSANSSESLSQRGSQTELDGASLGRPLRIWWKERVASLQDRHEDRDFPFSARLIHHDHLAQLSRWSENKSHSSGSKLAPFSCSAEVRADCVHARPDSADISDPIVGEIVRLLDEGAKNIQLTTLALILVPPLKEALLRAASRGAQISIITNGRETHSGLVPFASQLASPWHASRRDVEDLLRAGIHIYKFCNKNEKNFLHQKLAIVDDHVFIGSHNLNVASTGYNDEMTFQFNSEGLAREMREDFDGIVAQNGDRLTLDSIVKERSGKVESLREKAASQLNGFY